MLKGPEKAVSEVQQSARKKNVLDERSQKRMSSYQQIALCTSQGVLRWFASLWLCRSESSQCLPKYLALSTQISVEMAGFARPSEGRLVFPHCKFCHSVTAYLVGWRKARSGVKVVAESHLQGTPFLGADSSDQLDNPHLELNCE